MSSYTHELVETTELLSVRFDIITGGPYTIPAHWHEYVEILYQLHGTTTAVIQAETYHLKENDLLIINSNDLHMTQVHNEDSSYILLQIPENELLHFLPEFESLRFHTFISPDTLPENVPHPGSYIREMLNEYEKKSDGYQLLFTARLYELLYVMYRNFSFWSTRRGDITGRDIKRITQVMDWVKQNYQQPLTLNQAADSIGLSREYFCRMFKKYTGQTFLEYLNAERAIHLYDSLRKSDQSLTLLMENHGITNYKVFMRTFKKMYGNTPQKIRKSLTE